MSTPISGSSTPLVAEIKLSAPVDGFAPSHHVLAPAPGTTLSSYLPHWSAQPAKQSSSLDARSSLNARSRSADRSRSTSRDRRQQQQQPPEQDLSNGITCLPSSIALVDLQKAVRIGFRNPWPSWHKPTVSELWQGLEWGEDQDPAIDYAIQDADLGAPSGGLQDGEMFPYLDSRPASPVNREARNPSPSRSIPQKVPATTYTRQQKVKVACKQLLTMQEPDFDFDASQGKLKATWLGHAGVLLQLPPLNPGDKPIRILFDPIFSQRCSPTQVAGPIRSYPAPCPVSKLPPIDMVIISHNHYDHLDYETIKDLWNANRDHIRFIVPLGNKEWFVDATFHADAPVTNESTPISPSTPGALSPSSSSWSLAPSSVTRAVTTSNIDIPQDRVTELDWWDEVHLTRPSANGDQGKALRVICTPAQHGSGRYGVDANCALWSSWFVEHPTTSVDGTSLRAYFGGDTGCQFHGRAFPPAPPKPSEAASNDATPLSEVSSISDGATLAETPSTPTYHGGMSLNPQAQPDEYPACPAFDEIVARLGAPSFLMLPIAVGATISFLRTHVPLPDSISPFPRILPGLTAANHMPPWDAVGVFNKMTLATQQAKAESQHAVCMAIHWGTFISGPEEVLKTLGQLKWACNQQGVEFARSQDELQAPTKTRSREGRKTFVALNHGASITL